MSLNVILLGFLGTLAVTQIVVTVPFTARLIVETVSYIELRLCYSVHLPFDWPYVIKGRR